MIWSIYLMLGVNMWWEEHQVLPFDDEAWEIIIEEMKKQGLNTIVLDLAEGIQYKSHPELAKTGAWDYDRVKYEIARLKKMGITIIPKMNFSATHHLWLGEYRKMMSTKIYYDVCRDLINEVYELFEHPEYIHIGMDEEGNERILRHQKTFVSYRKGDLLFHDFNFLRECVENTGAKLFFWGSFYGDRREEFNAKVDKKDELLISTGYYHAFKKEHFKRVKDDPMYIDFYSKPPFCDWNLEYVEDDPALVNQRKWPKKLIEDGYSVIPTASTYNHNDYNADDLVDHYKSISPKGQIKGFMTAPWIHTTMENIDEIVKGIRQLGEAKRKYYPED